ncbi:ABC-F family ATP-binding cassette domain-containing protein [Bauldia sp.]|uniref:ABC-F family ATP-binding cassette domain-containing protein n=1 Tax=Bauldia sp. TaxID=2575872 RepID=UPI003BAAF936
MPSNPVPSLVALRSVTYATPDGRTLLDNVTLTFGRERTGLVGRNGIGKSTLLRLVAGDLAPASGTIERSGRVGFLRQAVHANVGTVADAYGTSEALACLDRLEAGHGSVSDAADADWDLPARIADALARVQLTGLEMSRPLASLSGGQQTRVALAALMFGGADLILLDEPTNNLDSDGRAGIAEAIAGWRNGAIVVSHDRTLLRRMDRIVELSGLGVRSYGGNYDFYRERQDHEHAAAEQDLRSAKHQLKATERAIQAAREKQDRRASGGKRQRGRGDQPKILLNAQRNRAEQTASAGSALAERKRHAAQATLRDAEATVERVSTLSVALPPTGLAAGKTVLAFDRVSFTYANGPPILNDVSLILSGPQRTALTGSNGSGKTTFLRLAAGDLAPTTGTVRRPVKATMLDQHVAVLDRDRSIIDNFRTVNGSADDNACHAALARFLFRADAAHRLVGDLSGGEILRAALAVTLGGSAPPQLLILDEPTNHLDLDSTEAIEVALRGYNGALLVASHDTDFLDAISITEVLAFPLSAGVSAM